MHRAREGPRPCLLHGLCPYLMALTSARVWPFGRRRSPFGGLNGAREGEMSRLRGSRRYDEKPVETGLKAKQEEVLEDLRDTTAQAVA